VILANPAPRDRTPRIREPQLRNPARNRNEIATAGEIAIGIPANGIATAGEIEIGIEIGIVIDGDRMTLRRGIEISGDAGRISPNSGTVRNPGTIHGPIARGIDDAGMKGRGRLTNPIDRENATAIGNVNGIATGHVVRKATPGATRTVGRSRSGTCHPERISRLT
jgi:hypothetical protein